MTITPAQSAALKRRIRRHVAAQIELSWIGSKTDDGEICAIEAEAAAAQAELNLMLERIKE